MAPPVFFQAGEPKTFEEFGAQEPILAELRRGIDALQPDEQQLRPMIFIGPAGGGKTLLARVTAHELDLRAKRFGLPGVQFFESFPAVLNTVEALDAVVRRCHEAPGCVLFIDEVHDLKAGHTLKLYEVLTNHRYQFQGDAHPTKLSPFTLLSATTDYGKLHPASRRRWKSLTMRPATQEQILALVKHRPFGITNVAADSLVSRTHFGGAPWEALQLLDTAVLWAKARGAKRVELADIEAVFENEEIDEFGLAWLDRQALVALFKSPRYTTANGQRVFACYGASQADVCSVAGVDLGEYTKRIFPKLMSRGLVEKRGGVGQVLTDLAVKQYGYLRLERPT
jgi:Holliday junction DNA helicase RuvB